MHWPNGIFDKINKAKNYLPIQIKSLYLALFANFSHQSMHQVLQGTLSEQSPGFVPADNLGGLIWYIIHITTQFSQSIQLRTKFSRLQNSTQSRLGCLKLSSSSPVGLYAICINQL